MTAFSHKEPDRIPIDFGGTNDSGLCITNHKELEEYYNQQCDEYNLYDWITGMVVPDERLLRLFNIDTRCIACGKGKFKSLEDYYKYLNKKRTKDGSLA